LWTVIVPVLLVVLIPIGATALRSLWKIAQTDLPPSTLLPDAI